MASRKKARKLTTRKPKRRKPKTKTKNKVTTHKPKRKPARNGAAGDPVPRRFKPKGRHANL